MHRKVADNSIIYGVEDLVLFRESPFASWMERLTLENPDHGIKPDEQEWASVSRTAPQDSFADALRAVGRAFVRVPWEAGKERRGQQTLAAMRDGADFIVDGELVVGPLAGPANLLIRSSGPSELGDYLYLPCDTQGALSPHSAFRLAFLADLLHDIQGQLPPELLLIETDHSVHKLPTEDHIYYYRALKQRFMLAQRDFLKHRMPDPAESSHFGRWTRCANQVIRRRWLAKKDQDVPLPEEVVKQDEPPTRRVRDDLAVAESSYDLDSVVPGPARSTNTVGLAAAMRRREHGVLRAAPDPVLRLEEDTAPYIDSDRAAPAHPLDARGFSVSRYRKPAAAATAAQMPQAPPFDARLNTREGLEEDQD